MMQMDETFPEGTVLVVASKTKLDENSDKVFEHSLTLDLSGATLRQVAAAAARTYRIQFQNNFRNDKKNRYPKTGPVTILVRTIGSGTQTALTKQDAIRMVLAGMPEDVKQGTREEQMEWLNAELLK